MRKTATDMLPKRTLQRIARMSDETLSTEMTTCLMYGARLSLKLALYREITRRPPSEVLARNFPEWVTRVA